MSQITRQRTYEAPQCTVERIIIDFNPGVPGDLAEQIVSDQIAAAGSRIAVVIATSGCTGIAGAAEVKQSAERTGGNAIAYTAPATLTPTASGLAHVGVQSVLDFNLTNVVVDISAVTLPSAGRMVIDIISKH